MTGHTTTSRGRSRGGRRRVPCGVSRVVAATTICLWIVRRSGSGGPTTWAWTTRTRRGRDRRFGGAVLASRHQEERDSERRDSSLDHEPASFVPPVYQGPVLQDTTAATNNHNRTSSSSSSSSSHDGTMIQTGVTLAELGLDLVTAPSTVAPGQWGLFAILSSNDTERVTIPAMTLLCGYSREGIFQVRDEGDKTVGFALANANTAVFYQQRLWSVLDALELAAHTEGTDQSCGLAGHVLVEHSETGAIELYAADNTEEEEEDAKFKRYFVPRTVQTIGDGNDDETHDDKNEVSIQNLGQFCNDLAWNYAAPPQTSEEYDAADAAKNIVQLVWRLEYDSNSNCLVPSWPVSVISRDIVFENADRYMELGTRYGWNYWQATIDSSTTSL